MPWYEENSGKMLQIDEISLSFDQKQKSEYTAICDAHWKVRLFFINFGRPNIRKYGTGKMNVKNTS